MAENLKREVLPVLALRGIVAFPNVMTRIDVGRLASVSALEKAMEVDQRLFAVAQIDENEENPTREGLYAVGTIVKVKQVVKVQEDLLRVAVIGEARAELVKLHEKKDFLEAEVLPIEDVGSADDLDCIAHMRVMQQQYKEIVSARGLIGETVQGILGANEPGEAADMIASSLPISAEDRMAVLGERDIASRCAKVISILVRESAIAKLEEKIRIAVHEGMDERQKEFFLREQLHAIHEELGDTDETLCDKLYERLEASPISGVARQKVTDELHHYESSIGNGPEANISRSYIETMLDLPWGKYSEEAIDMKKARRVLEQDHYGLKKVKERILEYLAVRGMNAKTRTPILCLVGPPGVGKSIARAAGREYVRMSLGGVRDDAEIRGHRRTYLGAIPGRIISLIKTPGVMNPLFLLDEIDKMASDFRGDPASAMLEVLDPEQNAAFSDHYLEAPFDLSRVMFVTTANSLEGIPEPLRDRMEIIAVEGYTLEEKVQIAKRHLWPKQRKEHGFKQKALTIADDAIRDIIDRYTRESGVRQLERELAAVCRKCAVKYLETPKDKRGEMQIQKEQIEKLLGANKFSRMQVLKTPEIGVVNGLAWTPYGGETLSVEVASMQGSGAVELTGQLGDVMKESAKAAYSYIRTKADSLGIVEDFHKSRDLHIHVPEGATPKDGPSAGVALTCAMVSAITGRPARQDVAMTGEITLLGRVLPIGGVKEKLLAAYRMGIGTVLLPKENEKDLEELPDDVRGMLDIRLISDVGQAIGNVLTAPH